VVSHTHGEIIQKIKFFANKGADFMWGILPLLKPMKVHAKDVLYNQGDHAEEIFFIVKGRVKLYYDLNEGIGEPNNVPFNLYVEGSYFGDADILVNEGRDGRDGTAEAETVSQLLILNRKELKILLEKFDDVAQELRLVAEKRKEHHESAI
jgi:CRP-like cAMP-binding protein